MNAELAGVSLTLPTVPNDFNNGVGIEFARAILQLLQSAKIVGLPSDLSATLDFGQIQASINDIKDAQAIQKRTLRHVIMNGVTNAELWVPFQDIGTSEYAAWGVPVIPLGSNPGVIQVQHIEGTKQNNQCKFRIDGTGATYKFEFFFLTYASTD